MQVPGSVLVRSHILWRGRHWLMVTRKQMKKKTVCRMMVASQRIRKVRVKAGAQKSALSTALAPLPSYIPKRMYVKRIDVLVQHRIA